MYLKGNFVDGKIKDTLTYFYHSGKVKSREIINRNKTNFYEYYTNGQLKKKYRFNKYRKRYYYLYEYDENGFCEVEINYQKKYAYHFYDDGKTILKESNPYRKFSRYLFINDTIDFKQSKNLEISYYSNGIVKQKVKNTPTFWFDRFKINKRNIYYDQDWTKYDSLGRIQSVTKMMNKSWLPTMYRGDIFKLEMKDFRSVSYYKNDKEVLTVYPIVYKDKGSTKLMYYNSLYFKNDRWTYIDLFPEELDKLFDELEIER